MFYILTILILFDKYMLCFGFNILYHDIINSINKNGGYNMYLRFLIKYIYINNSPTFPWDTRVNHPPILLNTRQIMTHRPSFGTRDKCFSKSKGLCLISLTTHHFLLGNIV